MASKLVRSVGVSLKEWDVKVIQCWWGWLAMLLNAALLIGFLGYLYSCTVRDMPVPWWDALLLGGFSLLFMILSFAAFHRVRVERDRVKEQHKGYDITEKEPWSIVFARLILTKGNVGHWSRELALDAKVNDVTMRLWLKSQEYAQVRHLHLRVVERPPRNSSQTWYTCSSLLRFLAGLPFYLRNFGHNWRMYQIRMSEISQEPIRNKAVQEPITSINFCSLPSLPTDYPFIKDVRLYKVSQNEWQIDFPQPYEMPRRVKGIEMPMAFNLTIEAKTRWRGQLEIRNESPDIGVLPPEQLPSEFRTDTRNVYRDIKIG